MGVPGEGLGASFREATGLVVTDEVIEALLAAGRAAWPKVGVAPDRFLAHVARHVRTTDALASVHAGDLYLACAAAEGDRAALTYLEEHFLARVPDYVVRLRIDRDAVDEVQQKLRENLVLGGQGKAPKIAEYSGKGALGGWIRVAAVRTALNHLRAGAAGGRAVALREEMSLADDPELAYVKEQAHELFASAFRRVLAGLDANERTILRLHYIDGLTMDQLSRLYKTPRSTIARRVAEARDQILVATEAFLRDEGRLSASAVASVIRRARSQLDVTISRLLS